MLGLNPIQEALFEEDVIDAIMQLTAYRESHGLLKELTPVWTDFITTMRTGAGRQVTLTSGRRWSIRSEYEIRVWLEERGYKIFKVGRATHVSF